MTQSYIPSDYMLIDLLVLLKDHRFTKNNKDMMLRILLEFLQKLKDVKPISEKIAGKMEKEISEIAFNLSKDFDNELRWHAFEIIKILNRPSTIEKAMEYFLHLIKNGYEEGSCFNGIYAWLAKSPEVRAKLVEEVEKILIETTDEKVNYRCNFFFQLSKNTTN